jgi:hypothetical protein
LQHLVIGSGEVPTTYGVEADLESPPYLAQYDRPLLAPSWRKRVLESLAAGDVGGAIYTARPSLPPADVDGNVIGYSPEAEASRALVGLDSLPLIGAGKMRWLAAQSGEAVERLVKPSPVQALAAIGAAASGLEARSLRSALELHREGRLLPPLDHLSGATVHVFEDTVGGLAAVEQAIDALRSAGQSVEYEPYGVVVDAPKVQAMAGQHVETYGSIDDALAVALDRVESRLRGAGRT